MTRNLVIDDPEGGAGVSDISTSLTSYEDAWGAFPNTHDEVASAQPDKLASVSSLKINTFPLFIPTRS